MGLTMGDYYNKLKPANGNALVAPLLKRVSEAKAKILRENIQVSDETKKALAELEEGLIIFSGRKMITSMATFRKGMTAFDKAGETLDLPVGNGTLRDLLGDDKQQIAKELKAFDEGFRTNLYKAPENILEDNEEPPVPEEEKKEEAPAEKKKAPEYDADAYAALYDEIKTGKGVMTREETRKYYTMMNSIAVLAGKDSQKHRRYVVTPSGSVEIDIPDKKTAWKNVHGDGGKLVQFLQSQGDPGSIDDRASSMMNYLDRKLESFKKQIQPVFDDDAKKENIFEGVEEEMEPAAQAQAAEPVEDTTPVRTASEWIRSFKKQDTDPILRDPDYPSDKFAKIMAARMLVNSERNKKDRLVANSLSEKQITDKAEELKNDPTFQKFIRDLKNSPKKLALAEAAASAASRGHGGVLDDQFKEYLKNLPAGELPNKDIHARYLPTVKERIEILQNRAKNQASPYAEAAEIVVLRNLIKAERNKKAKLDAPIPTAGTRDTLREDTETLKDSEDFREAVNDPDIKKLVAEGHGGLMSEKLRQKPMDLDADDILSANSAKGKMERCRDEADRLHQKLLTTDDPAEVDRLVASSRKVLGEYFVLNNLTTEKNGTYDDKKFVQKLTTDLNWGTYNKGMASLDTNASFNKVIGNFDREAAAEAMNQLANKQQKTFFRDMQNRLVEAEANKSGRPIDVNKEIKKPAPEKDNDRKRYEKEGEDLEKQVNKTGEIKLDF